MQQGPIIVRAPVNSYDLNYEVPGGIEVQLTRSTGTQPGWRYLKYDYRKEGFTDRNELNGSFLQVG
jgi:hypothetical protein